MRLFSLAGRNMKEIYRDPISLILGIGMPVLLILLFTSIGKGAPVDIFMVDMLVPAVAIFSFGFLIMFSATLLVKDRQSAFLTRLLAAPLTSSDFILAYILPFIPFALLQIAASMVAGVALGMSFTSGTFYSLAILIPVAVICIGIGMVLGSLFTENQVAAAGSIIIVVISLFSGAWMDLEMVGGIFEKIGYILPFAHAVDASRAVINGAQLSAVSDKLYWIVSYLVVFICAGILSFWWKTKR